MNNQLKRNLFRGAALVSVAGASCIVCLSQQNQPKGMDTKEVVKVTNAFLATLTPEQKKKEVFAWDDETQRKRWSNFPVTFVKRGGLSFQDLTPKQTEAAMKVLSTVLSRKGLEKVTQIMGGDEYLKKSEGGNPMFGKDLYYFSILGTPSEKEPWMLQFGGHHLAINITISGNKGILTPTLTGAQPANYIENGKTIRPLAEESEKGLALLNSLSEDQKKKAILNYRVSDLVLGPGQDGKKIVPEGIKGSEMTAAQKNLMMEVIGAWAGIVEDGSATARLNDLRSNVDDTWFAWSGSTTVGTTKNISAYYRIQGPKVVIEYAPQSMGGDASNHVHTMYRDPTNDYGRASTTK